MNKTKKYYEQKSNKNQQFEISKQLYNLAETTYDIKGCLYLQN